MDEPEVTGSGAEDNGEHDDELMMTTPPKVRGTAVERLQEKNQKKKRLCRTDIMIIFLRHYCTAV